MLDSEHPLNGYRRKVLTALATDRSGVSYPVLTPNLKGATKSLALGRLLNVKLTYGKPQFCWELHALPVYIDRNGGLILLGFEAAAAAGAEEVGLQYLS